MTMHLLAQDREDLDIISSAMQDAVVAVKTLRYDRVGRNFVLQASRFLHETTPPQRTLSGLRIDGVDTVRFRGIDRTDPESFTVLLNMAFEADDAPGGTLTLNFAGGGEIVLDVEAIDMTLADVGRARRVNAVPQHS